MKEKSRVVYDGRICLSRWDVEKACAMFCINTPKYRKLMKNIKNTQGELANGISSYHVTYEPKTKKGE